MLLCAVNRVHCRQIVMCVGATSICRGHVWPLLCFRPLNFACGISSPKFCMTLLLFFRISSFVSFFCLFVCLFGCVCSRRDCGCENLANVIMSTSPFFHFLFGGAMARQLSPVCFPAACTLELSRTILVCVFCFSQLLVELENLQHRAIAQQPSVSSDSRQ